VLQNKVAAPGAKSIYKYAKISPKKVMPVLTMVRGKRVGDAVTFLTFDPTKAAKLILKTLNAAVANAGQQHISGNLYVAHAVADTAPTAKRGRPGSRSHYNKILKRSAHITVVVGTKEGN
jgi:large subunit ribosomal protein L22